MTKLDLIELRKKAEAADAVAPAGWEADCERMTDAPNKHHEFFVVDGSGNRMFGTENADAEFGLIEVEDDGDGFVAAWNEHSRRVIEFAVAAQPCVVIALIDRVEKAEAERASLVARIEEADAVSEQFNGVVADRNDEIAILRALLARAGEALKPLIRNASAQFDHSVPLDFPRDLNRNIKNGRSVADEIKEVLNNG